MKKTVIWLDNYLEEFFMVISLILMTVIMGIQVFSRYVLGSAPSWSEEITRYLFVWSGFLSCKSYFFVINPFAVRVSAQRTAPPAAPRTVLWESPINL